MDPGLAQAISEAQAVHELRAEIERLRAALVLIATMDDEEDEWDGRDRFHRARGAARSALTNEQSQPRTEDEAAEQMDNGRSTGGKSYLR